LRGEFTRESVAVEVKPDLTIIVDVVAVKEERQTNITEN
jgi:hypothetical protein